MSDLDEITRREALRASILVAMAAGPTLFSSASEAQPTRTGAKPLVVYFSRTGNTRVIANQIQRAVGADRFEIVPAQAYPEDYEETVRQAQRERDSGYEPSLQASVQKIASYSTIYLGFPIWGTTAPPVIRSFLSSHDLSGKTLVPFISHGGYGLGNSLRVLRERAPRSRLRPAFSLQADQERETLRRVTGWMATSN